jgi:alkylation response protein AidB-like acyl-CoA dehydrogenase
MIFVMHTCGAQSIASSTTLAGRDKLLAEISAGRHLTTLALSERGSRSNFWAPVSRLVEGPGGYSVSAYKSWSTSAHHADSFVSSAQMPNAKSPLESTGFLFRRGQPGVRVVSEFDGLGLRGNDSAPIALENVTVVSGDLVTDHGGGAKLKLEVVLPWFAIGTAAIANGLCQAAIAATVKHLSSTSLEHTGQALRELPNLRARIADMSLRSEQSRALLRRCLDELEAGSPSAPLYVLESRLAGLEAAIDVTDLAMKACGGAAFSRHLPLERLFRDARAGWVMAPTADHLRDFAGKALTGLPLF